MGRSLHTEPRDEERAGVEPTAGAVAESGEETRRRGHGKGDFIGEGPAMAVS